MTAPRRGGNGRGPAVIAVLASSMLLAACGGAGRAPGGPPRSPAHIPEASRASNAAPATAAAVTVRSAAFAAGAAIPARFTCKGTNTPPPLSWSGVPAGGATLAMVMDDPDAPGGMFTHWVVFNLPPTVTGIVDGRLPAGAAQAQNSAGQAGYMGPCPPSGTHHYRFTVYVEQRRLGVRGGAALRQALSAIRANAIASGQLTGLFSSD